MHGCSLEHIRDVCILCTRQRCNLFIIIILVVAIVKQHYV